MRCSASRACGPSKNSAQSWFIVRTSVTRSKPAVEYCSGESRDCADVSLMQPCHYAPHLDTERYAQLKPNGARPSIRTLSAAPTAAKSARLNWRTAACIAGDGVASPARSGTSGRRWRIIGGQPTVPSLLMQRARVTMSWPKPTSDTNPANSTDL